MNKKQKQNENNHNPLDILPLKDIQTNTKNGSYESIPLNPILMGFNKGVFKPFLLTIVAPVRSGKTVFLNNLIYNPHFGYKKIFSNIYFLSPTVFNDDSGRFIKEDDEIVKISDHLENLDGILQSIVELQDAEGDEKENILIILDDCLGFLKKQNGFFNNFMSRYRHYKISLIITTQHFKALSVINRINTGYYIFFHSFNKKEQLNIEEEMSGSIQDFKKWYDIATHDKYNFLYCNLEKMECYHNFETLLWKK